MSYPNLPSAIGTVPQGPDVHIPSPPDSMGAAVLKTISDSGFEIEHKNSPQQFTQCELNDLVRDLGVFKVGAETLGSRLQSKHMFAPGTAVSIDISGLMFQLGTEKYVAKEYSAKKSLKGVLPYNGNTYVSVPPHSVALKETCENLEIILQKIKKIKKKSAKKEHMRQMCGDFKVLCMLLGQQSVNTKFPCFLCNGIAEHVMNTGRKTGQCKQTLHQRQKTFAIKDKNGTCFQYLCTQFPFLSGVTLKEGIFVGPKI
ncbi:hypothetical protein T06_9138 [Trichinella sp. T6]|nr:hypothetical protein T06_9138 [Trichinella sp. T6]